VPQSSTTPLASAQINGGESITIQVVEPDHLPAKVKVTWPAHASLVDPKAFPDVANAIATLFARAHIVLAALKASGEL
jgi:hypothetical protein